MAEEALRVWEATPAWPNGARSAFERHRLVLEDFEALKPKLRARLLLRAAELTYGMGGYVASGLLRPQIAVDALDPPGRDRHAFLSARLAARTPEAASLPTLVADGSALEEMRLHTVRAEAAFTLGRFDEAVAEWENVLESDAAGMAADEQRYEAQVGLARQHLAVNRAEAALALLEDARALALQYESPHDEAGIHFWLYEALVRLGRQADLFELARRADALPRVDIGGLPRHLVFHLRATERAAAEDPKEAVRILEEGIRELDPSTEGHGWGALIMAKATVLESVGRDYQVFRTLVLARNRLRRSGAEAAAALFDPLVEDSRARVGQERWDAFVDRLKREVQAAQRS
ncbi:MAG: hypothetical protein JRJ84_16335 [Deltaproteobacteria bacterium]|nr:hypothetical protein [Deltaproteobacteria bacterium]